MLYFQIQGFKHQAQQSVLVAILGASLVELCLVEDIAMKQDIERRQMRVGVCLAVFHLANVACSLLVLVAQFATVWTARGRLYAAAHDVCCIVHLPIRGQIVGREDQGVAVDDQDVGQSRLGYEEVQNASTSHILLPANMTHLGDSGDARVLLNHQHVGRSILGYDDFIVEYVLAIARHECVTLSSEVGHQGDTIIIVRRDQDRNHRIVCRAGVVSVKKGLSGKVKSQVSKPRSVTA